MKNIWTLHDSFVTGVDTTERLSQNSQKVLRQGEIDHPKCLVKN